MEVERRGRDGRWWKVRHVLNHLHVRSCWGPIEAHAQCSPVFALADHLTDAVHEVKKAQAGLERLNRVVHVPRDLLLLQQGAFLSVSSLIDGKAYLLAKASPNISHLPIELADALPQLPRPLPHRREREH